MTNRSLFEIIGPVMIGPSSSHTAGAVRLGRVSRFVLDDKPVKAEIILYGSFAETYRGHGTDRAIVGGLLGMNTDDIRIRDALELAKKENLEVVFKTAESQDVHPNTALIMLDGETGKKGCVQGSSVGGGNILITRINRFEVSLKGRHPTLLVEHHDKPGVIGRVTTVLGANSINIGEMRMARNRRGDNNFMVLETDNPIPADVMDIIYGLPDIVTAVKIELD